MYDLDEPWKKYWQSACIQEWNISQIHGQYPAKITDVTNNERVVKESGLEI